MKLRSLLLVLSTFLVSAGCEPAVNEPRAIELMSSNLPDGRREGMAAMVTRFDDGRTAPFVARYRQLAGHDPDTTVRAMAIRALNICRDQSSTPLFITGLSDPDDSIRLESAKALANVPDQTAVPVLVERLRGTHPGSGQDQPAALNETRDVRIAAADALRHYKVLEAQHALVDALELTEFGIAWQAHQSLVRMTDHDMGYNELAWLQLFTKPM